MKKDLFLNKITARVGLIGLVYLSSMSAGFTDNPAIDPLPQYLLNLGVALGYDISPTAPATPISPPPVNTLLGGGTTVSAIQQTELLLLLGTIFESKIVNGNATSVSPFQVLNSLTNVLFTNNAYNQPSKDTVSVSALINQQPYQDNPVSQAILDTVITPDFSFCELVTHCLHDSSIANAGGGLAAICCGDTPTFQSTIGLNVLGPLPSPTDPAAMAQLDKATIKQLNSNSLIAPLLFHVPKNTTAGNAANPLPPLTATNQAQDAENFIRYASSAVAPNQQTSLSTYTTYYNLAYQSINSNAPNAASQIAQAANAQQILSNYLTNMRVFAAQISVGVANLYDMLAKRMPQNPPGAAGPTSQALNEYVMATRRLNDPTIVAGGQGTQWLDQINTATPATVQKEIAVLLSEINYQLYLSRQQQDRLLLTNSIMLFQLGHLVQLPPLQPPQ